MKEKHNEKSSGINRRDFLRLGTAGTAVGAVTIPSLAKDKAVEAIDEEVIGSNIRELDKFPLEIRDDYEPMSNKDVILTAAFNGFHTDDEEMVHSGQQFMEKTLFLYEDEKGFDQLAMSLSAGGWALHNASSPMSNMAVSGGGILHWEQRRRKPGEFIPHNDWVRDEQYQFKSKKAASDIIKRAAKLYGADLVGITQRDPRWDYKDFVDNEAVMEGRMEDAIYGWERFPFEPKSVIVLAFEMDYEAIAAAPTAIEAAGASTQYSTMTKVAYQMAIFLKQLGYQAIPCGNDTGMSIPYAIAAGLGESSRMGNMVTYKYGPRVRLAKVYTDFDFVEYDKPIEFGVMKFCKSCMRCADACPGDAISFEKEPTWDPPYEGAWYNSKGVKKYYVDAKKCFKIWGEFGTDCGSCIAACPYNKPDFWHHRLVNKITATTPGVVHDFMREMDILFGYGDVDDPDRKVDKFFSSKGKNYNGR